jgi:prephenate dehydrogenase
MMDFPRSVTIYGVGLMGSSFALALKQRHPAIRIYGMDKPDVLHRAEQLGIIELGDDPEVSDLVVLATPVGEILTLLDRINPGPQLLLDLGSTKIEICKKAASRKLPFVGGHPMTGSERSGPDAASADLFKGARFFLCAIPTTPKDAIFKLERLIHSIGATPHPITPVEHDRIVAEISHLPQILSTVLADHTYEHRGLAGPGLKSVTRLAASPFHVWRDILETSSFLPRELQALIDRLRFVVEALEANGSEDLSKIEAIFNRANRSVSGDPHE